MRFESEIAEPEMAADLTTERPRVIYIAGTSFSGSTLLGLILGTDPNAVFVGEANQCTRHWTRTDGIRRECTCGEPIDTCVFWSAIRERYQPDVDLNPAPGFSLLNLRHMLRILSPLRLWPAKRTVTPYASLLEVIAEVARTEKPGSQLIVDSSKSIHSLDALARSPNVDLVVVHLIRDCAAVADSYKARGWSAVYGVVAWALMNTLVRLYARRHRIPLILVDYEAVCTATDEELTRLNHSLGTSLFADRIEERIRTASYHVFAGNQRVRLGRRDLARIENRGDRGRLGRFERKAANLVGRLVRAVLGDTDPAPLTRPASAPIEPEPS